MPGGMAEGWVQSHRRGSEGGAEGGRQHAVACKTCSREAQWGPGHDAALPFLLSLSLRVTRCPPSPPLQPAGFGVRSPSAPAEQRPAGRLQDQPHHADSLGNSTRVAHGHMVQSQHALTIHPGLQVLFNIALFGWVLARSTGPAAAVSALPFPTAHTAQVDEKAGEKSVSGSVH